MNTIRKHWISISGLILIYVGIYLDWSWIWGILFLFWVIPAFFTGVTYFLTPVERKSSPILFWLITATWLLLSAYVIAEPFLPVEWQTSRIAQIDSYTGVTEKGAIPSFSDGVYTDPLDQKGLTPKAGETILNPDSTDPKPDSLIYRSFRSRKQSFIGVSVLTSHQNDQYIIDQQGLWDYFYQNDISEAIPNIVDERVYLIYSDYDQPENGNFKMTLGYRTADLSYIYDGLEGITIPPTDFAVFESSSSSETFVQEKWVEIAGSDLSRANLYDVEVYSLDPTTYKVTSSQLRVSLKK